MTWAGRGSTRAWRTLRARILTRDPACTIQLAGICTWNSTDVDHIVPVSEGGTDDPSNLRGACHPCHEAKTKTESARGRTRARQGRRAWTRRPTERHPGSL